MPNRSASFKDSPTIEALFSEKSPQDLTPWFNKEIAALKTLPEGKRKAAVDELNSIGLGLMHYAAAGGTREVIESLIRMGGDVNIKAKNLMYGDETPMHFAARLMRSDNVSTLKRHNAAVDAKNDAGWTPLHTVIINDPVVRPFGSALQHSVIDTLLRAGADVNAEDGLKETPLHHAAMTGDRIDEVSDETRGLALPVNQGNPGIVRTLLAAGAKVDALNREGRTPLFAAVGGEHYRTATLLCEHGAKTDITDKAGNTPRDMLRKGRDGRPVNAQMEMLLNSYAERREFAPPGGSRARR